MKLYLFLVIALLSSGCTRALEDRMDRELGDLRSIQAEQTATINEIRSEMRTLQGRLDEAQHSSQGRAQELERSLRKLGSRVPPPPGVPEDLLTQDDEKIARLSGPAAEDFKKALQELRTGEIESALTNFQSFSRSNPGTAFSDNALFWTGICLMKLGQYDRAVVSFTEVYQQYPAEDMVAPALFFMSEALLNLGSREDAMLTLQKLVDEHPQSEYAAKARTKLTPPRSSVGKKRR